MAFQLITLPISIIFVLVFAIASITVLYKMRKEAKIYRFLFDVTIIGIGYWWFCLSTLLL